MRLSLVGVGKNPCVWGFFRGSNPVRALTGSIGSSLGRVVGVLFLVEASDNGSRGFQKTRCGAASQNWPLNEGQLLSGSRPHHDLPNIPSLTSGGLGRLLDSNRLRWAARGHYPL
ncbi:hypothetical protein QJS10_CPA06g01019 [Acorus calamus]|uniref:Uncharacterized protein n=1 Tax=Acorus calamus TaxID=4465 RepID=A0AAV9EPA9_ACOCL|nr:hypothetical protein QJS10_CPA06g01019 [Acorus calamus]